MEKVLSYKVSGELYMDMRRVVERLQFMSELRRIVSNRVSYEAAHGVKEVLTHEMEA